MKKSQIDSRFVDSYEHYAKHYDGFVSLFPEYEDIQKQLSQTLAPYLSSSTSVLDLGAGTGNSILALAEFEPNANFTHVDSSIEMNRIARQKYEAAELDVSLCHEAIESLGFEENSFDVIVSVNALNTVAGLQDILVRARSWLKPDGHAVFVSFGRQNSFSDWFSHIFKEVYSKQGIAGVFRALRTTYFAFIANVLGRNDQRQGLVTTHSTDQFAYWLAEAGFKVESIQPCYRGYSDFAVCTKGDLVVDVELEPPLEEAAHLDGESAAS